MLSHEEVQDVKTLLAKGLSIRNVAERTGYARSTVQGIKKRKALPTPPDTLKLDLHGNDYERYIGVHFKALVEYALGTRHITLRKERKQ